MASSGIGIERSQLLANTETTPEERRAAVRVLAANARDADDLTLLLEALGLNAWEGKP